jgi:ribonucleoside-diphosphate reductase alpha chain
MSAPAMRERPDAISGKTYKMESGNGALFVTINDDDKGMFEVFANIGKSGGYTQSFTEAIGRLISLALRSGIDPLLIARQLVGIRSPKHGFWMQKAVFSIPDGIGRAMLFHIGKDENVIKNVPEDPSVSKVESVVVTPDAAAEEEIAQKDAGEEPVV